MLLEQVLLGKQAACRIRCLTCCNCNWVCTYKDYAADVQSRDLNAARPAMREFRRLQQTSFGAWGHKAMHNDIAREGKCCLASGRHLGSRPYLTA